MRIERKGWLCFLKLPDCILKVPLLHMQWVLLWIPFHFKSKIAATHTDLPCCAYADSSQAPDDTDQSN